jgi:hypothetical protein
MINDYRTRKCWITFRFHYETVNKDEEHYEEFDQYLSCPPTRIFNINNVVKGLGNPYTNSLHRLTKRINNLNSKYIRNKSGLQQS